jgi:hypothetical protein
VIAPPAPETSPPRGLLPPAVTGPEEPWPPTAERLEPLMGRPRDMDPLMLERELGMSEVKKPELPGLVIGLEACALLVPDEAGGG